MNRRKLLKMLCVAPTISVIRQQDIEVATRAVIKKPERVMFEISGISLVSVLKKADFRVKRT